jgi:hypothetical protein
MANSNVTSINPAPFDPVRFTLELREVLSRVTVCGPDNIHNMDLVLNGLAILHNNLKGTGEQKQPVPPETEEEI